MKIQFFIVNKEIADLDKKYQFINNENQRLQMTLEERERELQKLQSSMYFLMQNFFIIFDVEYFIIENLYFFSVSEAVCKEYEQLKLTYDVETGALHKAVQQASEVCSLLFLQR